MARKPVPAPVPVQAGTVIGYARTSTVEQEAGLAAQERDLVSAGCTRVFAEQISSIATVRPQLVAALDYLRPGDVLVVTKPDRLARSTADLLGIVESLEKRSVGLRILSMGGGELDTSSPTGKLMITMLGAVAAFERELMLERQREGIALAKAKGAYKGRKPALSPDQKADVRRRAEAGERKSTLAHVFNVSRETIYQALREA